MEQIKGMSDAEARRWLQKHGYGVGDIEIIMAGEDPNAPAEPAPAPEAKPEPVKAAPAPKSEPAPVAKAAPAPKPVAKPAPKASK